MAGIGLVAVIVNRIRADLGLAATGLSFLAAVVVYGLAWLALSMILPRATNDPGALLPGAVLVRGEGAPLPLCDGGFEVGTCGLAFRNFVSVPAVVGVPGRGVAGSAGTGVTAMVRFPC